MTLPSGGLGKGKGVGRSTRGPEKHKILPHSMQGYGSLSLKEDFKSNPSGGWCKDV